MGSSIRGIEALAEQELRVTCKKMHIKELLQSEQISTIPESGLSDSGIFCLGIALPPKTPNENFNLLRENFTPKHGTLLPVQLVTAGILSILVLGTVILWSVFKINTFENEIHKSEQQILNTLKRQFGFRGKEVSSANVSGILDKAQREITREEGIWFAFSGQTRLSFLKYLSALSTQIDQVGLGLKLKKLTITKDEIAMSGRVKDYRALELLEEALKKTKLFTSVPALQETAFAMKIPLKKESESAQ